MPPPPLPPVQPTYTAGEVAMLERLARIETTLQANLVILSETKATAGTAKDVADRALACSQDNAKDIDEIKTSQTWTFRTGFALIAAAITNFIINFLQGL